MPGVVDGLEQLVMAAVAMTARVLGEVAPELTLLQWRALVILGAQPVDPGTSISALASALHLSLSAMSRVVRRLETRGLVSGAKSASDGRVRVVRLSAPGRSIHDEVMARRRAELERIAAASNLPDDGLIGRLARALGEAT
jgi:DNA-binding MarR family transcriptional regulator